MKTALILVDLQNDFVEGGALAVPDGRAVIDIANHLQSRFDLVVASQDWHPNDHGSHACNQPGREPGDRVQLRGIPQILWPAHCLQGTFGADFVEGLERKAWAAIFQKGTEPDIDSYSAFFDNHRHRATGLGEFLRGQAVTHVYVMGLATDYCVKHTALDALGLGFETLVIREGCRGVNLTAGDVERAWEEMTQAGVRVVGMEELSLLKV